MFCQLSLMSSLAPSITHFCNFGNSDSMFESFDSGLQLSKNRISDPLWGPVAQLGARFHGMEEVVGSIPTRSTKSLSSSTLHHFCCWFRCTFLAKRENQHG